MNLKTRIITHNPNGTFSTVIVDKQKQTLTRKVINDKQRLALRFKHMKVERKDRVKLIHHYLKLGYTFGGKLS